MAMLSRSSPAERRRHPHVTQAFVTGNNQVRNRIQCFDLTLSFMLKGVRRCHEHDYDIVGFYTDGVIYLEVRGRSRPTNKHKT